MHTIAFVAGWNSSVGIGKPLKAGCMATYHLLMLVLAKEERRVQGALATARQNNGKRERRPCICIERRNTLSRVVDDIIMGRESGVRVYVSKEGTRSPGSLMI